MSSITRRNFFKFLTLSAGATVVSSANEEKSSITIKAQKMQLKSK